MDLTLKQLLILNNLISIYDLDTFREQILRIAQPCFRLNLAIPDNGQHIGTTRIGGTPDFPEDLQWPQQGLKYLVFLAQIRLNELPFQDARTQPLDRYYQPPLFDLSKIELKPTAADHLPRDGMLYFFLGDTTNYDDIHHKIIYLPEAQCNRLKPTTQPPITQFVETRRGTSFPPYLIKSELAISFPMFGWRRLEIIEAKPVSIPDEILFERMHEIENITDKYKRSSRVLGYPYPPDHEIFWRLYKHKKHQFVNTAAFEKEYLKWQLLFEIYSHNETEMYWGDSGCLHFMIHEKDLENRDFSSTFAAGFSH